MHIRRPVVSVLAALAFLGGGVALTGCSDTNGLGQRTGTSKDSTTNFSGDDPTSVEQGSVYNHGNERPGSGAENAEGGPE